MGRSIKDEGTTKCEPGEKIAWNGKVARQFEQLLEMTPRLFRGAARSAVTETAETIARKRGSPYIEELDLVHACLQETPEIFKGKLFQNALQVGIDMQRYLTQERISQMQALSVKIPWDQVQRQFHPDVTWFEWCITSRCNLQCQYCYEDAGTPSPMELTSDQALEIIRSLGRSSQKIKRQFVICWSGGEPLLRQDLSFLIAAAREEEMLNTIATNGWFLTEELAGPLKDLEVSNLIITLDSMEPDIHDALRGKGSHARALRAIEHCRNVGLLAMVESVATRYNWQEIGPLKQWAEQEMGAFYFHRPVHRGGRAKEAILLTPDQHRDLYYECNREVFAKLNNGRGMQIPLMSIFDLIPFGYTPISKEERDYLEWGVGCQACRLIHGISSSGDLYPCIRLKLSLGNLMEEEFAQISEKALYRRIALREGRSGKCGDCPHVSLCGGGCLAEVMALKGDPFAGWDRCWLRKGKKDPS